MVCFVGQRCYLAGHYGFCDWAHDSGAQFTFDDFGTVQFNSNGYGENANVKAQLDKEYGRYFCSTAVCGGFKNWMSGIGTVTVIPKACRVTVTLTDCVTKTAMADVKCCIGLMCQYTNASGEAYLGQFAFGTYGLVIAKSGYENLVEDIMLSTADLKLARCLIPTGEPEPGVGCNAWATWLRPFCVYVTGLIAAEITTLTNRYIVPLTDFANKTWAEVQDLYVVTTKLVDDAAKEAAAWRESLSGVKVEVRSWISESLTGLKKDIETTLIDPILAKLTALWQNIGELWDAAELIVLKAEEEAKAWRTEVAGIWDKLDAWLTERIVAILLKGLDIEVQKETKK